MKFVGIGVCLASGLIIAQYDWTVFFGAVLAGLGGIILGLSSSK